MPVIHHTLLSVARHLPGLSSRSMRVVTSALAVAVAAPLVTGCATAELTSAPAGLESDRATGPDLTGQVGPTPAVPTTPGDPATEGPPSGPPRVGGSAPGTEAPPSAPPVEPLDFAITSPPRGAWLSGPSIRVEGHLKGGTAPMLTIGGEPVTPGPDGRFSIERPADGGLNVIVSTVTDGAETREDRRAVLQDADADPAAPVADGVAIKVSQRGFQQISALVSDYVQGMDLEALARENVSGQVRLTALRHGRIDVTLTPQEGRLEVQLAIQQLHVEIEATVDVPIVGDLTFDGSMDTNPGVVTGHLRVGATPEGGLDLALIDSSVDLRNFDYDVGGVPDFVEDWFTGTVRDLAEDTIQDALDDFVIPALFDPSSLTRTVEILGRDIELGVLLAEVESHADGLEIRADTHAVADMVLHEGTAVRPMGGSPRLEVNSHLDVAASVDLAGRVLHAAWAAGVLDLALGPDSGLESPVPLTAAVLAGPLGEAANGIDRTQPLELTLRPLLPPVARLEKTDHPLVIETGDLLIDIATPNEGVLVTVAVHFIAKASFDVQQIADGGQIELSPDLQVEVYADVAETPRGPVREAALETLVKSLVGSLPGLIADQTFAFGTDALPVPVRLENARLEPDHASPHLHLRADVAR
jgi:hypothetical protein